VRLGRLEGCRLGQGFVGDDEPALGEEFLDVAIAQREPQIEQTACWMITGGTRWRRYEISAIASAYPQPRFRAIRHPDIAPRRLLVLNVRKGSTLRRVGSDRGWLLPAHRVLSL
jgi:hypothetical protein